MRGSFCIYLGLCVYGAQICFGVASLPLNQALALCHTLLQHNYKDEKCYIKKLEQLLL